MKTGKKVVAVPLAPCAHRGAPTGETVLCPTCRGRVALKVFACAVHGTCLTAKKVPGRWCCKRCPDRTAEPS